MSGGSYNYLCFKDWPDIYQSVGDLIAMRDRLIELGYEDAARETEELRLVMRQHEVRVQTIVKRLSSVWQAVEWNDSGDSGLEGVQGEIQKYRGEMVETAKV